jgi:hypothetical protein
MGTDEEPMTPMGREKERKKKTIKNETDYIVYCDFSLVSSPFFIGVINSPSVSSVVPPMRKFGLPRSGRRSYIRFMITLDSTDKRRNYGLTRMGK